MTYSKLLFLYQNSYVCLNKICVYTTLERFICSYNLNYTDVFFLASPFLRLIAGQAERTARTVINQCYDTPFLPLSLFFIQKNINMYNINKVFYYKHSENSYLLLDKSNFLCYGKNQYIFTIQNIQNIFYYIFLSTKK